MQPRHSRDTLSPSCRISRFPMPQVLSIRDCLADLIHVGRDKPAHDAGAQSNLNSKRRVLEEGSGRGLGFLDRPRRHLHRRDRARPERARSTRKLLSESPAYKDAAVQAIRDLLGLARARRSRPARSASSRWARRSRPTRCWSARRAHAAGDDARFPRRAGDRLSGAAEDFRPQHRQAGAALFRGGRDRRARFRRRHGRAGARS